MKSRLPEGWKETFLSQIAIFKKGNAFKSKYYQKDGTRIVRVSDLTDNSIDIENCIYIDNRLATEYKSFELLKNDIILTTVGSWENNPNSVVGKVVKVNAETQHSLLNQNAVRIRAENMDQSFLYYRLKEQTFKNYILGTAQGSANQASITQKSIKDFKFNLPTLVEQKAIADTLSSLDNKIELNNKINKNLEQQAQEIFTHWFVDFEFPDENGNPYKSSGGEMVESELGMIPEGWEVNPLGELLEIQRGLSYKGKHLVQDGVPMINLGNVNPGGGFREEKMKYYDGEFKERHIVKSGDIVIANTDMTQDRIILGSPCIIPKLNNSNIIFTHHLFSIKSIKLQKSYIYFYLKSDSFREVAESYATGTAVLALPQKAIVNIEMSLPNQDVLEKFDTIIKELMNKIENSNNENIVLSQLRDTLLPKLMSGEIRIPLD